MDKEKGLGKEILDKTELKRENELIQDGALKRGVFPYKS